MEIKYYTGLIDDLDLSVRSYNCLRRAGIQTIQDLLKKTEEGWSSFQKIRNLGAKSSREIIMKLKQLGYNIEKIETEICDWVNDTDFITAETKYEWLNFLMELKNVSLDEQGITVETPQKGLSLMTLKGVHYMTLHRLNNENIFTIEDLLEKYKEAKQLTEPNLRKWELLRALDKAGYRFEDCSKEEFPNINDYIYLDRLNNFNIDDLEIDEDIKDIIDYQNLNMLSIVKSSIEDLTKYFSKTQIVELIIGMDEQGIKMEICEDETEVKDFIVRSIEMPTNEFLESKVTCSNLQKKGITTINKLISYTRSELLESKIVGDMALQGIVEALKKYKLHLEGDTTYKCDSCREEFITAEEHTNKHYCELCKEKAKRIKKVKEINISIKGPDYGSYTNGSTGFTLFATITNNSAKFEEVSLKDFFVYHKNRQWASTSYLTGYRFETEHIMPKSSLTAGKIWSGYEWKSEKLLDGDYISLYLSTKEKNYTFKFVLKNSEFVLDDYFTS